MSNVEDRNGNFIDRCLRGEVLPQQIDEFVDDWYARACPVDLPDYLGMAWDEYLVWVTDPALLPLILRAHRENRALAELMAQAGAPH